jgi:glycoside/pentoside/hexuronide:cation symporter, GPH family
MADADGKISLGEKFGYALGDAAANFVLQMRLAFLNYFYTDVYHISATTVAALQVLSHVVDAFNDLVMGALSDRTQTRWGKFRPWIFWSAIPLGLAGYLVFAGPQFGPTGKIVYAAITLNLMIIAYGANNIPYSALGGVISDDPDERVSVASWRMIFAMTAAFFVLTFTLDMVQALGGGNELNGFRLTGAVWGVLAVACSIATFIMTRERIRVASQANTSLADDLRALVANPAWRVLAVAASLIYTSLAMRGSVTIYYFKYVLLREDLYGKFSGFSMAAVMIGIFFSKSLTQRYGKRNTCCGGLIVSSLLASGFLWLPTDRAWPAFVLQFVFQVSFGTVMPVIWGMIADVADLTEWRSGRRITALTFAATLFFFKIGQGIGMALVGAVLQAVGYKANVTQTPGAIYGIQLMMSVLPAGLFCFSGLVISRYAITQAMEQEMMAALRERREQLAAEDAPPLSGV